MKNTIRYNLIFKNGLIFILSTIITAALFQNLSAQENVHNSTNEKKAYSFNYDQEIPTLIRYDSKISGVMSKTGYLGLIKWADNNSMSSINIGYNITAYELAQPPSFGRILSMYGVGYIPFIPDILFCLSGKERNISMVSPLVGYSYSQSLVEWFGIGFSINTGPAYAKKNTPWENKEEFENDQSNDYYDYDEWVEGYSAMHDVPGHWGGRINTKIKLYFICGSDNDVLFGLNFGYTQYFFRYNHFNSYDIGPAFTLLF